jgi:hypothetical protein
MPYVLQKAKGGPVLVNEYNPNRTYKIVLR